MSKLQNPSDQKNPLIGVISLCISIISILGLFCTVAFAGFFVASGKVRDSLEVVVVGLSMFGFVALGIVSIVLGCVGLTLKNKRKSFAITGISLSAFAVLVFALLMYVGFTIESNKIQPKEFRELPPILIPLKVYCSRKRKKLSGGRKILEKGLPESDG